jgi:hypothetical protein
MLLLAPTNALTKAVNLFVCCYNARQLRSHEYPRYPTPFTSVI